MINKLAHVNLLLLGQTGSAKSSLLNYLAKKKIVETGDGKPVTKEGEFNELEFTLPDTPQIIYHVYDSWGLEANKSGAWERVISEKLNASLDWEHIIGGVIFCISYMNGRIEPYEKKYTRLVSTKLSCNYCIDQSGFCKLSKIPSTMAC